MLNTKQQTAIELLLSSTEQQTAQTLGVRKTTIYRWLNDPEFCSAIRDAERRQHKALIRIAGNAALNAVISLCTGVDTKTALEVLKLSKVLEQQEEDPAEALAEFVKKVKESCESERKRNESGSSRNAVGMGSAREPENVAAG